MAAHAKRERFDDLSRVDRELVPLSSATSSGDYSASSFDDYDEEESDDEGFGLEVNPMKKQRIEAVLPVGFLDPIKRTIERTNVVAAAVRLKKKKIFVESSRNVVKEAEKGKERVVTTLALARNCRQFWKAGDYDADCGADGGVSLADMDHVRVHPRFLHSNATSHKWALGAFAELLDNALDEVCTGATSVRIDVLENKDVNKMVVVQDDGGGMTPDRMRQCMSLGYSAKSKMANTIGQYGNGFKTSTMRLGADVIVFSRCQGKYGGRTTQSIGMLSYTFLQNTGKEDIVVPMVDYEQVGKEWNKQVKSSSDCWHRNLESIVQWSPFEAEEDLLQQFNFLQDQGTRIIIYNLWEDDQGSPELDFDTDEHDIQIRGASRDERKIEMADTYPSCRHFLTYRHSLRNYAGILYRRIPLGFRIILRGVDVQHHNIVNDLIHTKELVYKPAARIDSASNDPNMVAAVTLGFVKDARHHIDVQGFNVYHKNRLIKPFWRVWNAAGSDGRGVIGILEANFVEPAHDKQGFERTVALSRLEARLIHLQKNYWSSNCHLIGYAQRRHSKKSVSTENEASAGAKGSSSFKKNRKASISNGTSSPEPYSPPQTSTGTNERTSFPSASGAILITAQFPKKPRNHRRPAEYPLEQIATTLKVKTNGEVEASNPDLINKLKEENDKLRNSLKKATLDLQYEKDKNKSLQNRLDDTKQKLNELDREQEVFVNSFAEERKRRDEEEVNMKKKLNDASETIQGLLNKVEMLDAALNAANALCKSS